ncbi:MAG TPA: L-threonylcarbamoyladenylate synthase [Pyrinomonadaceae bacterium]
MKFVVDSPQTRQRAASLIRGGGVVAFLTDTFYGLGADPFNRSALRKLNELKGRDGGKPILIVLSDVAEAERFIKERSELFEEVSRRHWPGALTLVVKARDLVPEEITAGSATVGLRLPDDNSVRDFIRICGGALTATSANTAGAAPARTAAEVASYFPEELDLIVDSGASSGDKPSTVLDVSGATARMIREGAVSREELQKTLRALQVDF